MTLLSTSVDTALNAFTQSDFVRDGAHALLTVFGIMVCLIVVAMILVRFWPHKKK